MNVFKKMIEKFLSRNQLEFEGKEAFIEECKEKLWRQIAVISIILTMTTVVSLFWLFIVYPIIIPELSFTETLILGIPTFMGIILMTLAGAMATYITIPQYKEILKKYKELKQVQVQKTEQAQNKDTEKQCSSILSLRSLNIFLTHPEP